MVSFSVFFLIFVQDINEKQKIFSSSHQVATDVIKEFAADGVKYLELRSTPREEKDTGMDVSVEYYDCMIIIRIVTRLNS